MLVDGLSWVDRELELRQHLMYEPFSLGAWFDYVEQEYELLLIREQKEEEGKVDQLSIKIGRAHV